MDAFLAAPSKFLRGRAVSGLLHSLGIDAKRFWVLTDLYGLLGERGEILDQLGANGVALKAVALIYAVLFSIMGLLLAMSPLTPWVYSLVLLAMTAFFMLSILLSEAGNSLFNPAESLILAHHPVNGATFTAAKLTHLARIVLVLVPAMDAGPALAGLLVAGAKWSFPIVHMLAALAAGLISALLCCAVYGWLLRLVPARRLRAAGQLCGTVPLLGMMLWQQVRPHLPAIGAWLPAPPRMLAVPAALAVVLIVVFGIRSLSADYLIRVTEIAHAGPAVAGRWRRSRTGWLVSRLFGGQPARAGFEFTGKMMRRDFQFRRQGVQILIFVLTGMAPLLLQAWRADPFSSRFSTAHLVPHILGFGLLATANLLPYGNDFKGAWIFLLPPAGVFGPFARGIFAALWIQIAVLPNTLLLFLFSWTWGPRHAVLFCGFSLAMTSFYLALVFRLIDGAPFSNQWDPRRQSELLPQMVAGGIIAAVTVLLQYFVVFRTEPLAAGVAAALGLAAYLVTRSSVAALESAITTDLGRLSGEAGTLYREVDV